MYTASKKKNTMNMIDGVRDGQVTNAEVDDGNVFDNIQVIQETINPLNRRIMIEDAGCQSCDAPIEHQ